MTFRHLVATGSKADMISNVCDTSRSITEETMPGDPALRHAHVESLARVQKRSRNTTWRAKGRRPMARAASEFRGPV